MNNNKHKDNLSNIDLKSILEEFKPSEAFKLRKMYPDNYSLLAEQLKLYPRAIEKLPKMSRNYCFFTTKAFEQASSEITAEFKSSLFKGDTLVDLSGGLGADDIAFSNSFSKVISVDKDKELNLLARINFKKLGIINIERIDADAETFLKKQYSADLVYIDSDRRSKGGKSLAIENSEPQVLKLLDKIFKLSSQVLLKLSPLADITYIIKSLPYIKRITVLSTENEIKEILVHIINNWKHSPVSEAVDITKSVIKSFSTEKKYSSPGVSEKGIFFFEPAKCLVKAGLSDNYAGSLGLNKISQKSIYLTGNKIIPDFFGRSFSIRQKMFFSKSSLVKYLKENKITFANLARNNFFMNIAELRKLTGLKEGGNDYFFFTVDNNKEQIIYHCNKVAQ